MERLQKSNGSISKGFHMFSPAKIGAPTYEIWLYESNWLNLSKWDDFYTLMSKSHICFSISWPFFNPQTLPWSQRFFSQANSNGKPICQRKNNILQGKPFFKQYDLVQLSGFCLLPVCIPHLAKKHDIFLPPWTKKSRVIFLVETQCCLINLCPPEHLMKSISQFLTFSPEENHWWFAEICPSGTNWGNYRFQIREIILSIFFNSKPKGVFWDPMILRVALRIIGPSKKERFGCE